MVSSPTAAELAGDRSRLQGDVASPGAGPQNGGMFLGVRRFSALAALVARIYGGYKLIQLSRGEAAAELDQLVTAVDARHERCESGEASHPEKHPAILRARPGRRNVALQSRAVTGKLRRRGRRDHSDRRSCRAPPGA